MRPDIHVNTRVLPGGRIEIAAPELKEGEPVEVIVKPADANGPGLRLTNILEFLDSLPPGPRSAETWEELERLLREERDSWDR
ncbi:MAG: hypothetical protein ACREJC_00550 [Tepidisphaeraceae bacterium]